MGTERYEIEFVKVSDLKPYDKNAKKHPAEQIDKIAKSIQDFGFRQNLVIDKNNVVIVGHGRLLAAKKLVLVAVPCMRVNSLSEAQIRALRLADNRVAESDWDLDLLKLDLEDLDIDMTDFGFDLFADESEDEDSIADEDLDYGSAERDNDMRSSLQHNVFENQERMQFETSSFWGIPEMEATQTYSSQLLRFCDHKDVDDLSQYIAHFYYDDYKFINAWRLPDKYIDKLRQFKAVISPDFSLYTDFPRALQILSCYRRQWCGAYWQSLGLDVIPDVVWGDRESYQYCFDGIPQHSVVAVSSVGVATDGEWNDKEDSLFRAGYTEMLDRLKPTKIIYYGTLIDGLDGDIVRVPSFYEQRRKMLNERRRNNGNKI